MEPPDEKMNIQTWLAADHRRQLNRFRGLLPHMRKVDASSSASPSAAPISMQAFAGFLMVARTVEQVRSYILANPKAAAQFARDAAMWESLSAPHPPDQLRAMDEANQPFFVLGWVNGGDPESTVKGGRAAVAG